MVTGSHVRELEDLVLVLLMHAQHRGIFWRLYQTRNEKSVLFVQKNPKMAIREPALQHGVRTVVLVCARDVSPNTIPNCLNVSRSSYKVNYLIKLQSRVLILLFVHLETLAQLNRYEFPKLIRPPYNDFGKNLPPKGLIYMLKTGCKNVVGNIVQHGCQKWEAGGGGMCQ